MYNQLVIAFIMFQVVYEVKSIVEEVSCLRRVSDSVREEDKKEEAGGKNKQKTRMNEWRNVH